MSLLADLVLLLHAAFILFVILGGLLVLRTQAIAWLHLPCVIWGIYIELTGGSCPLTPLENMLRAQAGDSGYTAGFIEHYLAPLIYPAGLTPGIQYLLAGLVLLANLPLYLYVLKRRRRKNTHD